MYTTLTHIKYEKIFSDTLIKYYPDYNDGVSATYSCLKIDSSDGRLLT